MHFQSFFRGLILLIAFSLPVFSQSDSRNWQLEQRTLHEQFNNALQELAQQRLDAGDKTGSQLILEQRQVRDPQRQYIFVPNEANAAEPTNESEAQLHDLKIKHADQLLNLAREAANHDAGAIAFQLLHEVLFFHPDHEAVREMLSHRKTDEGWRVASERIKVKKASRRQAIMGWQPRTYLQVTTPHFTIDSIADEATTVELAEKLERWHYVWRQVFFEFWSTSTTVNRWINGEGRRRFSSRKYNVVFFADRGSYTQQLEPKIPGISASTGYYSDQSKASFFFAGEETTWRHELTHQLFQETRKATQGPFKEGHLWLGEGIAMYFESLIDFDTYVTLGGFDARRMQYSRFRMLRERFFVPLSKISALSQQQFQSYENPGRLYSQSAGMTHLLMTDQDGKFQKGLIEFLKLTYMGRLRSGSFEKIVGLDDAEFKKAYSEFLATSNESIEQFLFVPETRTELSLGNRQLSDKAMEKIAECVNLRLLDLSENKITPERMKLLADCDQIDQLFLSNCRIARGSLQHLAQLNRLEEVDLTASDCSDEEFLALAACSQLKLVTLRACRVSETAVDQVRDQLPNLVVER